MLKIAYFPSVDDELYPVLRFISSIFHSSTDLKCLWNDPLLERVCRLKLLVRGVSLSAIVIVRDFMHSNGGMIFIGVTTFIGIQR